ncbi:MAG: formylglycine-generating enzyme family protein, partial [Desulfamplus sp.]|nr:formylglycine-generating enzyme family protein [Desulfamplus sp.]
AGTFMMGSPENEHERYSDETQHRVTLTRDFYMQTTPVTQGQWKRIMGNNPSYFKDGGLNCPVENVSWDDCQDFIRKLNRQTQSDRKYRLPTEAEWEYACRAGTTTPYYFGNNITTDQVNYKGTHPYADGKKGVYRKKTTPVKSFPCNQFGLYDMHGNVWEWCHDWYGEYPSGEVTDPAGPASGTVRVLRGGAWDIDGEYCRSASRNWLSPSFHYTNFGLRLSAYRM